jgi:hypothetical protein
MSQGTRYESNERGEMRHMNGTAFLVGAGALGTGVLVLGVSLGLAISDGTGVWREIAPSQAARLEGSSPSTRPTGDLMDGGEVGRQPETARHAEEPRGAADLTPEVLRLAVTSAPFEESRRPPNARYRLPEDEPSPAPPPVERPEVPEFRLMGSVATPDGGWALIRVGDGTPQLVAAGESVAGYTLAAVQPNAALMSGVGQVVQVPLAQPSMTGTSSSDDNRRGNARRNRGDDEDDDSGQSAPSRIVLPSGLPNGVVPPMAEAVLRQMQTDGGLAPIIQRLQSAGGNVRVQGQQVIMTGPGGEEIRLEGGSNGGVEVLRRRVLGAQQQRGGGE